MKRQKIKGQKEKGGKKKTGTSEESLRWKGDHRQNVGGGEKMEKKERRVI